ncbi:MAG: M56 family metallopeptidase [Prevotella sp.]|nr:M56 family metallopeptidase [Prevotella sp.]
MLLVYQLKVGLCLIVFYLLWKLLLSRETLHRFNRVLLLVVMVLSLLLPWVKLSLGQPTTVGQGLISIEDMLAVAYVEEESGEATSWNLASLAYIIYIIGVAGTLVWHLYSKWRLRCLLRKGRAERLDDGITLHVLSDEVSPFSYFRHIVISEKDMVSASREILTHERAHIRLLHSYDLLFVGVVLVFQWWNPAAWLLCRELKQVHEYEADEAVLQRGVDARQYQLLLIRKSVGDQLFSMANNLNYQSLKKRIRMMTTKRSSRWQQLRALAIVPVAALAVVAFARPEVETVAGQIVAETQLPAVEENILPSASGAQAMIAARDTLPVFDMVEQLPEFPGGNEAMLQYLVASMKYPKDAQDARKQGRVVVQFIVNTDGTVEQPRVLKSVFPSLDEEAIRVVNEMPRWKPGMQKGKAVRVKFVLPITFRLSK